MSIQTLTLSQIQPSVLNPRKFFNDTTIEELNEALNIEIDYPEHETVSLLILETLQGFPRLGEKVNYGPICMQTKKMSKKKIEEVLVSKL